MYFDLLPKWIGPLGVNRSRTRVLDKKAKFQNGVIHILYVILFASPGWCIAIFGGGGGSGGILPQMTMQVRAPFRVWNHLLSRVQKVYHLGYVYYNFNVPNKIHECS